MEIRWIKFRSAESESESIGVDSFARIQSLNRHVIAQIRGLRLFAEKYYVRWPFQDRCLSWVPVHLPVLDELLSVKSKRGWLHPKLLLFTDMLFITTVLTAGVGVGADFGNQSRSQSESPKIHRLRSPGLITIPKWAAVGMSSVFTRFSGTRICILDREIVISWLLVSSQDLVASGSLKFPSILWFSGASGLLISQPVGCLNRSRFSESFWVAALPPAISWLFRGSWLIAKLLILRQFMIDHT